MIANDQQLEIVREQAARLESAVRSLLQTVRPKSEAQFRILAEGPVDQLVVLRQEIDAYLGVAAVTNPEPDIEVSIEDAGAALGDTRVSAVTKLADRFRRALRVAVESVVSGLPDVDRENTTSDFLDRLCDPRLQAVAPGSVKVQLASPRVAVGEKLYAEGLSLLSLAIRAASGDVQASIQLQALPVTTQKAALNAAKLLAPEQGDLVGQVGIGGRFLGPQQHVRFDIQTRKRIVKRLSRLVRQTVASSFTGVIREVDLDRRLFTLRDPETSGTVDRFKYGKTHDADVERLVNHAVVVSGNRRLSALRATRWRVRTITEVGEAS